MANTKDVLGEAATLSAIVGDTLTSFEDDTILKVKQYTLGYNKTITNINLPSCSELGQNAFESCTNLETITLGPVNILGNYVFSNCQNQKAVFLNCPSMRRDYSNGNSYVFISGSPMTSNKCFIYVPSQGVSNYKKNMIPLRHLIFPNTDYPRQSCATISDSWADIIAASQDGTYDQKYNIGDTAIVTIDGTDYLFELIAKDLDELADNSGKAHMTWLGINIFQIGLLMASGNSSDWTWANSTLRSTLNTTIFSKLPAELQAEVGIKSVKKPYYSPSTTSTLVSNDKIWIPSSYEVGFTGSNLYEDSGVVYPMFSIDNWNTSNINPYLIKFNASGVSNWWLRTYKPKGKLTTMACMEVSNSGNATSNSHTNNTQGTVFGFCV